MVSRTADAVQRSARAGGRSEACPPLRPHAIHGRKRSPRVAGLPPVEDVVGVVGLHQGPEALRVVQLPRVAELVDQNVIDQGGLQEQQPQVERYRPARLSNSPSGCAGAVRSTRSKVKPCRSASSSSAATSALRARLRSHSIRARRHASSSPAGAVTTSLPSRSARATAARRFGELGPAGFEPIFHLPLFTQGRQRDTVRQTGAASPGSCRAPALRSRSLDPRPLGLEDGRDRALIEAPRHDDDQIAPQVMTSRTWRARLADASR